MGKARVILVKTERQVEGGGSEGHASGAAHRRMRTRSGTPDERGWGGGGERPPPTRAGGGGARPRPGSSGRPLPLRGGLIRGTRPLAARGQARAERVVGRGVHARPPPRPGRRGAVGPEAATRAPRGRLRRGGGSVWHRLGGRRGGRGRRRGARGPSWHTSAHPLASPREHPLINRAPRRQSRARPRQGDTRFVFLISVGPAITPLVQHTAAFRCDSFRPRQRHKQPARHTESKGQRDCT